MILDYEQELTTAGGQLFDATDGNAEYGTRPYDMMSATPGDPAPGEKLEAVFKVHDADSDVGTSLDLQIVCDDDGAGTSEVVVASKLAVLVASLTRYSTFVIPIEADLCVARYLNAKVTTHGTKATTGKLKVWIQKARDGVEHNGVFPTGR